MGALEAKVPAARVYPESAQAASRHANEVRIAFDGDAVLFSDEAERVFQKDGLDAFTKHETTNVLQPLPPGPFKPLLEALHRLQSEKNAAVKIRTALVTARSAPAHERAVRTLMEWNIAVDEAMFLGGLEKSAFLEGVRARLLLRRPARPHRAGSRARPLRPRAVRRGQHPSMKTLPRRGAARRALCLRAPARADPGVYIGAGAGPGHDRGTGGQLDARSQLRTGRSSAIARQWRVSSTLAGGSGLY